MYISSAFVLHKIVIRFANAMIHHYFQMYTNSTATSQYHIRLSDTRKVHNIMLAHHSLYARRRYSYQGTN